jgi:hypothetical protein
VYGVLFLGKAKERLQESMEEFLGLLDGHISRTTKSWLEAGSVSPIPSNLISLTEFRYFIGISLACSLLEYGDEPSALMNAVSQKPGQIDVLMEGSNISEASPSETFAQALSFAVRIYRSSAAGETTENEKTHYRRAFDVIDEITTMPGSS